MKTLKEFLNEGLKIKWPVAELNELGKELKALQFMLKKNQSSDFIDFQHGLIKRKILNFSTALVKSNPDLKDVTSVTQVLFATWEHDTRATSAAWVKKVVQNIATGKV